MGEGRIASFGHVSLRHLAVGCLLKIAHFLVGDVAVMPEDVW